MSFDSLADRPRIRTRPTRHALVITGSAGVAAALEHALESRGWSVTWSRRVADAASAYRLGADLVIADVDTPADLDQLARIAQAIAVPPIVVRAGVIAATRGFAGAALCALLPGRMDVAAILCAAELLVDAVGHGRHELPLRVPAVGATKWIATVGASGLPRDQA